MLRLKCIAITSKHTSSAMRYACSLRSHMGSMLQHMSAYLGKHAPQRQGCAVLWMLLAHALSQGMAGEVAQQLHQPAHTSTYQTCKDDVHPEAQLRTAAGEQSK